MAGNNQRISRRKQLERLLGQEINVVFLMKESDGKKQNEFDMGGIIEKRNIPSSNQGYYIKGTDVQISLNSVKINPRPYSDGKNNVIVVTAKYSSEKLNSVNPNL